MATIGNIATPTYDNSYSQNIDDAPKALVITMTEDGTADSIWFYGETFTGHNLYAAIYDASGDLVTNEVSPVATSTSSGQTYEIPLTSAALSNAGVYTLVVAGGSGGTPVGTVMHETSGHTFTGQMDAYMFFSGTWPATGQSFTDSTARQRLMHLEYSTGGGGGGASIPVVMNNIRQQSS